MQMQQVDDEYELEHNAEEESGELIQALGWRLTRLAQEQIGIRQQTEDRWLSDLEQYMGHYDAETLERLKKSGGSHTLSISHDQSLQALKQDCLICYSPPTILTGQYSQRQCQNCKRWQ